MPQTIPAANHHVGGMSHHPSSSGKPNSSTPIGDDIFPPYFPEIQEYYRRLLPNFLLLDPSNFINHFGRMDL
jgi:hypothetical protein